MSIAATEAVIFDMDGTLVDSELLTEKAVLSHLDEMGIDPGTFDCTRFYGLTWEKIGEFLAGYFPGLKSEGLAAALRAPNPLPIAI